MSDSHWDKVKDVFQTALEKSPGAARERYLDEACGADDNLRGEVLALLESFAEADDFLDAPPVGAVAAEIIGAGKKFAAGQRIGRYRIERMLGAGGMGEVYLATDTELERPVALKILAAAFSANPDRVRRFVQEARAASALNHPNILTIYEIGQCSSWRFIATEYIAGETLRERIRRAPLGLNEIADVFGQTAAALEAAHRARIVHRDIKPENVMLREDGLVKVLDFGLAKLIAEEEPAATDDSEERKREERVRTTPGLVMGTVAYMSPEQARGLQTDARTDVWSLGVCLSETVFGTQPFAGETVSDQIAAILKSEADFNGGENADAPPELRRIIEKCLEKRAENRYQTIADFLRDVRNVPQESDLPSGRSGSGFSFAPTKTFSTGGAQTGRSISAAPRLKRAARRIAGGIKRRRILTIAASVVAVAALGSILYFAAVISFFSPKPIRSVAVLPFTNESGNSDGEYLSDGLSDGLTNKLSKLPQLKIAARGSAFQYKNKSADAPEVARALGVEAIVTGRVTRRGNDLQIGVELIDARDSTQMWGETYLRKVSDAQAVEEEIARAVVRKLQIEPANAEQERNFDAPVTTSGQAYQLYLNGVFYRRQNGPENVRRAIEYQNQAIRLDPNFALAYAELGYDHYNLVGAGVVDSENGLPPARAAIEKALSLNDSLAEAHDINSRLKSAEFDWAGAESEIRRAIELNPNLATAHTYYSTMLSEAKRFDEALHEIRLARRLDPLRINLVNYEAEILFKARRYDDAQATYDTGNPEATGETFALINRARVAAAKERYPQAIALLQKSLAKDETTMGLIHLGRIYRLNGDGGQALAVLERLREIERTKEPDKNISPAQIAVLYSALGQLEQALVSLERAFVERDLALPAVNVEPEYDELRGEPRFQDLLRRMAFPQ